MVVFLGIRPGQVPEEPQPEGLDPFRDWHQIPVVIISLQLYARPETGMPRLK